MSQDYTQQIERGVELLKRCQQLQSEKDGIERPEPGVYDRTKTLDDLAKDVEMSVSYMVSLHQLVPMRARLAALGRKLEQEGKLQVEPGEDYSTEALKFVLAEHGLAE